MDPYDVLGVTRDASNDEIKEAYREKAKEFHPDTSDRDDAAEMFKKVKEAYEVAYSGDSEGFSPEHSSEGSRKTEDDGDRRNERGDSGRTGEDGFGTTGGWTPGAGGFSETGEEHTRTGTEAGKETGTRTGTDERKGHEGFHRGWNSEKRGRREKAWKKSRNSYEDKDKGQKDGEDPEDFDVREVYEMGWKLGQAETGEWFVFTEGETAPYVDSTKMLYLDRNGDMSTEAVYFATKEAAEGNYEDHYGAEGDFGYEDERDGEWEKSHRGFNPEGESYTHRTEERTDGFGEEDWGKKQEFSVFDGLWRLYYQEKTERGRKVRRWSVTTKVTGDNRFVNPKGEYQRTEFWFDERDDAVSAYEKYVRRMREAREGFEGADVGEGDSWETGAESEKDTLLFRAADMSVTFLEGVDNAVEPLKENSRGSVVAAFLLLAAIVYFSETVRGILSVLATPVYIGFVVMVQTPHLIFFVVAYAAIVTVLVVARMSTKF